jgi:hypothetical protein
MKEKLKKWFVETSIKAIKTIAETAAGLLTFGAVMSEIDWVMVGSASLLSGIYTFLINVKSLPGGEDVSQQTLEEEVEESEVG